MVIIKGKLEDAFNFILATKEKSRANFIASSPNPRYKVHEKINQRNKELYGPNPIRPKS